ncbi:MAG: tetratricopeptide repeat protein [Rhizomicrobium sp.]
MNRLLTCTSVIALCAGIAMSAAYADEAKHTSPAATSYPTTLTTEIARAKDLREKGQLADAAKALRQLMLVAGNDPRVAGEYGKVLVQQGYAKDAASILTKAVQMNGADWTLHSALGVAYDQLDNHAEARKAYARALTMKPGEPSVTNNYAVSRMLTGDYDGAIQMLSALHSSDPKIAANLAKAEEMQAAHAPKVTATAAQPSTPASTVVAAAKPPTSDVVMQKVPVDPKAGPVRNADRAPRALETKTAKPVLAAVASKLDVGQNSIVMQKVPVDPKAGPVKTAATKPANKPTAQIAANKPALKSPPPPALRTASD